MAAIRPDEQPHLRLFNLNIGSSMSYPPHHSKVLIAGGSIAGLALANALEQAGIDCLVLEKYPIIAPDVGASICIFPNGFKILDQLGCYGRIKDIARDADSFRNVTMRNKSGNAIIEVLGASKQIEQRYVWSKCYKYNPLLTSTEWTTRRFFWNVEWSFKHCMITSRTSLEFIPAEVSPA